MTPKRIFLDHRTLKPMKMRPRRLVKICVLLLLVLALAAEIYRSQCTLTVTHYEVASAKITSPITIVHLSDLHNRQFGRDNTKLIALVAALEPDLIIISGDMLTYTKNNRTVPVALVEGLAPIAPVYYGYGNHEQYFERDFDTDLTPDLEAAGATVVELRYHDTEIAGNRVRIGGACGYIIDDNLHGFWWPQQNFMRAFGDTDDMKILIAHRPEGLLFWGGMETYDTDLIFSGHRHGGQMRLPLLGGVFTPESGFFPGYTEGLFEIGGGTLILSRGLGSGTIVPRLNNVPEVICVKLVPAFTYNSP
ncbi:MAG: metallophosphoesterase [Clostridiales bacterium]|nr:metallophosphoesterase [Clostridiales bacterium]